MEVPLLVSGWQCAALERAAHGQGLTLAQLLRRLIGAHLAEREDGRVSAEAPTALTGQEGTNR